MANQLLQLLEQWFDRRDDTEWVLGTVYRSEGPCYRKAGAMMLFNGLGQQFGLLSGGCLESDIQLHARRVMQEGRAITLSYDGSDEDDLSFRLGIGCGGTVYIMLQPVTADNHYLYLDSVYLSLRQRRHGCFYQLIPDATGAVASRFEGRRPQRRNQPVPIAAIIEKDGRQWLSTPTAPPVHLLVVGAGLDARPLVAMAAELGWRVTLVDPRPANARPAHFRAASAVLRRLDSTLTDYALAETVDAVVLMSHNVDMDAAALAFLQRSRIRYMALLGPRNRRARVLEVAGVSADSELEIPLAGPAGLDIGAALPESIALSILSECHACLHGASARPLTDLSTVS